jgi:AraC-like DNA-binding protein
VASDAPRPHSEGVYQLRSPAPPLQRYIEHYWFVTHAPDEVVDLRVDVFVDARADLIFNFGAPYRRELIGGASTEHQQSNVDAQRMVPVRIVQRGAVRVSGVRFRLGGLGPFTTDPLDVWTDGTPAPREILGEGAVALEQALAAEPDLDAQAALFDGFFTARLTSDASYTLVARALEALVESDGRARVEDVADAVRLSARQLERLFARWVGLPPKTIARVLRFQATLRALMRDPGCSLAELAARAGYFDQAHFIKDFKRMSGGVPRGYRGYFPPQGPSDFAPNVVVFLQDDDTPPT